MNIFNLYSRRTMAYLGYLLLVFASVYLLYQTTGDTTLTTYLGAVLVFIAILCWAAGIRRTVLKNRIRALIAKYQVNGDELVW